MIEKNDSLLPFTVIDRRYNTGIKSPPTVLCETDSVDDMLKLIVPPSTIIVYVDNMGICYNKDGSVVLGSLYDVCCKVACKMLLTLYVRSEAAADFVINFCKQYNIMDISVMSDDMQLVKKMREALPTARGVIDFRAMTEIKEPMSIVSSVNSHHAKTAVINGSIASRPLLRYLQQRMITVFLFDDSTSDTELHCIIQYGPNGIITADPDKIRTAYEIYPMENTIVRHPFIIGHRGIPDQAPENTMPSFKRAVECGAETLETDIHITSDKQLIIMHDDNFGRTSEGSGLVREMTFDELTHTTADKLWKGTQYEGALIPSYEEFLEYNKNNDCVLFVEIKENNSEIVDKFLEITDKYDMRSHICVISFFTEMLQYLHKKAPDISLGFLWLIIDPEKDVMEECERHINLATENFACMDLNINRTNRYYYENLMHRGLTAWPWTYENPPGADNLYKEYFYVMGGMTTNNCEWTAKYPVDLTSEKSVYSVPAGQSIDIKGFVTNRLKNKSLAECDIFVTDGREYVSVNGCKVTGVHPGKASIILRHTFPFGDYSMTIYSVPVEILVTEAPSQD